MNGQPLWEKKKEDSSLRIVPPSLPYWLVSGRALPHHGKRSRWLSDGLDARPNSLCRAAFFCFRPGNTMMTIWLAKGGFGLQPQHATSKVRPAFALSFCSCCLLCSTWQLWRDGGEYGAVSGHHRHTVAWPTIPWRGEQWPATKHALRRRVREARKPITLSGC